MDSKQYKGYTVYPDGRIKSNGIRKVFLKGWDDGRGYSAVKIKGVSMKRHNIIAYCFIGYKPKGFTVNHKDGNKLNNHISNLEYISRKDNYIHALNNGKKRNISNYLSADQASDMVEFYFNTKHTMKEICSWLGFNRIVLSSLINDKHKYLYKK